VVDGTAVAIATVPSNRFTGGRPEGSATTVNDPAPVAAEGVDFFGLTGTESAHAGDICR
jgi:hypothetical protein